jgi:hypothetical protein
MAGNKYYTNNAGVQQLVASLQTSAGAGSAGGIVALNSSGLIDASMLPSTASALNVHVKTANFNANADDFDLVDLNTAGANVTATLPDATTCAGQSIVIMVYSASSGHAVTIATTSSQTINGVSASSLATINTVDQDYWFLSDGSNWWTANQLVNLASSSNVFGILGAANGGLGYNSSSAANGHLPLGNGSGYVDGSLGSSDSTITWTAGSGTLTGQVNQGNLSLSSIGGSLNLASQVTGNLAASNSWMVISVQASEAITGPALVNLWNSSSALRVRNADNTSTLKQAHGVALSSISSGSSGNVLVFGIPVTGLSGLTIGPYFLGTTGGLTSSAPTASGSIIQATGFAVSTTELFLMISPNIQEIA